MKKSTWILIGIITGLAVIAVSFSAGAIVGNLLIPKPELNWLNRLPYTSPAQEENKENTSDNTEAIIPREELFIPFWESWDIVHDQFIDQPVDDLTLMRGAISGMLDSLGDEHTGYMDPDLYIQANMPLDGEYEGIGAWVDTTSDYLTIISPMPDSPAEKAGLLPGDEVIEIDGQDMTGLDGSLVIRKVLGPAGSKVVLTIHREGEPELFDVTIIRAKIVVPSIDSRMLENNLGYIQILTFGQDTRDELRDNLERILNQNPDGLVVDLRNNGGGYLQTAVEVASEFISNNVILYEDYGPDQNLDEYQAMKGGLASEIPLVLLVNEGSASASEIVAGAIQDHERGPLVGATTFGKGSVQNWIELTNNQGAVRVTIARWLTPDKRQINDIGIEPDFPVEFTEEDFKNELDPQLDKAVEVLLDLIGGDLTNTMFYFNPQYLFFMAPAILAMLAAQWYVNSTYRKWGKVSTRSQMTGEQITQKLILSGRLNDLDLRQVPGNLTDHYDPRKKTLSLSPAVYQGNSVASVAIAAHELGHAMQDKEGYFPLQLRSMLVPAVNIGSTLGWILIMAGLLLNFINLAWLGVFAFSGGAIFALATLPVELNASARSKALLKTSGVILSREEEQGVNSVLNAAALTYVASLFTAVMQLLYWVSIISGRSRRR